MRRRRISDAASGLLLAASPPAAASAMGASNLSQEGLMDAHRLSRLDRAVPFTIAAALAFTLAACSREVTSATRGGHDPGGVTTSLHEIEVVADGLNCPAGLALNHTDVFWTECTIPGNVGKVPKA